MTDDLMQGFTAAETARFHLGTITLVPGVLDYVIFEGDTHIGLQDVCALLNEQDATITQLRENIQHLRTELGGHQLRVEKLEAIETRARLVRDRQLGGRTGIAITQEMNYVLGENKP